MPRTWLALVTEPPAARRRDLLAVAFLAGALALGGITAADGADLTISRADLAVTFNSPTQCHVRLRATIEGPRDRAVEHRLMVYEGTQVTGPRIAGATSSTSISRIGRTLALVLSDREATHVIEYDVAQPPEGRFRCPVWLPTVPSKVGPGRVHLLVTLPPGATLAGSRFPLLAWSGGRGEGLLGDLPSIVRTTFSRPGEELRGIERIDPGRMTDLAAVGMLITASLVWALGRRRR
jgi:hypothetical protein